MSLHKEISFETEICQHLAANGWLYAETQGNVEMLQEHHTALISAVTSQIDVRNIIASGPAKQVIFANA